MGDPPVHDPGATENDIFDEKKSVKTKPATTGRSVHVCAAAEDRTVLDALVKQLTGVRVTHAGDIQAGGTMDVERRALLDAAGVIVLLVSADFVASPEHETDVAHALERHAANGAQVVPVLCRPCNWEGLPYAGLLALPRDNQPLLVGQALREDALAEVAREIRALIADPVEVDAACPFPGLEFFDEDRAADFFGREAQISEALAKLADARPPLRWLQIDGPSGAGKSSFARAGIVPVVRAGKLMVGPKAWVTAVMRPGYDPITSLAEALVKRAKPPLDVKGSLDTVTRELSSSTTALKSFLREHVAESSGVLLVVDQLEETFTLAHADENGVKQFDALLATALDDREGPLVLVTTVRSDFVARMGELPALEEKLPTQAVRYYLRPMDEAGLHAAIEKPAERAGLAYEDGLVDRIVADASTSRGALPLVAHVLEALYVRREGLRFTARAYDFLGGVGGALAKSADAIIDSLEPEDRARAQRLLLRLVKIGRGNEDTRQTATREAAIGAAGGGTEAERVLARLSGGRAFGLAGTTSASGRLLVVSGEAGKERVDLVHEALIQRWGTLRTWIKNAREELELRDDVEEAARIWEASGSSEDGLPRGTALARLRGVERSALQSEARAYLDAAEKADERHRRRARRMVGALLGFAAVLVIGSLGIAWQTRRSREETRRADKAGELADTQTRLAKGQAATAETRRLLALAEAARVEGGVQQQALLAVEAWKTANAAEVLPFAELVQALGGSIWGVPHQVILAGHKTALSMAAFSPDGKRVVTASFDRTARVWDANGASASIVIGIRDRNVRSAVFSPDGRRLVTSTANKTACVWSADGVGEPIVLRGHTDEVNSAAFSSDGKLVVTASDDKTARVWNADGTGEAIVLRGHQGAVSSAVFSPDGKLVVTSSEDKTARVWNANGAGVTITLRGYENGVARATFSPDNTHIVATSREKTVRIWNVHGTGEPIVLRGHTDEVNSAAFSPDGGKVVTASDDDTARIWNIDGTEKPIVLRGHADRVTSAAFSPDGERVVTASVDKTARVWQADGVGEPMILRGHENQVTSAAFSPDGGKVVTASYDGLARIWILEAGEPVVLQGTGALISATFTGDGTHIISTAEDRTARVWRSDGTGTSTVLRAHKPWLKGAAFSPDGRLIITTSDDNNVELWNSDGTLGPIVLRGHEETVTSATFSADGTRIVTTSSDKTARVWNTDGNGQGLILRGHEDAVTCAAFSLDGKRVVTASVDKTARVWNLGDSREPLVLRGHDGSVLSASFSADGTRIVTASTDKTTRVWDLELSRQPIILRGHTGQVVSARFSADGTRVVSSSSDKTARVWSLDNLLQSVVLKHDDWVATPCANKA